MSLISLDKKDEAATIALKFENDVKKFFTGDAFSFTG